MLTDSHAHLTISMLKGDLKSILEHAQQAQVSTIININTNPQELTEGFALQQEYPWIYNAGATTPHDVEKDGENDFPFFSKAAASGALIAVGETGLDYYYKELPITTQKEFFRRYLKLARAHHLPIIIHCRDAFDDLYSILDEEYTENGKHLPAVLHCFTGSEKEAREGVERGFFISISGIVTFKKSHALQEIATKIPLAHLLIETDAPFLAPTPHRGKQNEPAFLSHTAQFIAQLKNISCEELAQMTTQNARSLFSL